MIERDTKFDNLKGLIMLLIVFGHCIERTNDFATDKTASDYLYVLMYTLNIPTIAFLSGYFSKGKEFKLDSILNLFVTFLLFHVTGWLLFTRIPDRILTPWWTSWYLFSLICWKLMIPLISKFRFALLFSIVIALIAGFTEANRFMAISRTLCFFPYFIAGYKMNPETIHSLRKKRKWLFLLIILSVFLIFSTLYFSHAPIKEQLLMTTPYEEQKLNTAICVLIRFLIILSGFAMSVSLTAVITEKKTYFASLGKNSLTVYVFHSFALATIYKLFAKMVPSTFLTSNSLTIAASIVLTILICLISRTEKTAKAISFIVNSAKNIIIQTDKQ